ncbi:hypothetical protein BpHYR1_034411 [Brachionus plicatilis]|uniref:Uncharacterized protein n=1 Tax=Brachionus plicatilis TaxID=10195 RepID=A0A3M7QU02_BRAPC|nr:hypothetical protein BpHYR1_034411 [Brachionus plicatilis]
MKQFLNYVLSVLNECFVMVLKDNYLILCCLFVMTKFEIFLHLCSILAFCRAAMSQTGLNL